MQAAPVGIRLTTATETPAVFSKANISEAKDRLLSLADAPATVEIKDVVGAIYEVPVTTLNDEHMATAIADSAESVDVLGLAPVTA